MRKRPTKSLARAPQNCLEQLRKKIDTLDRELIQVLRQRARYSLAIGKIKKKLNLKIYSPQREKEILRRLVRQAEKPLSPASIARLFKVIMSESRKIQRSL